MGSSAVLTVAGGSFLLLVACYLGVSRYNANFRRKISEMSLGEAKGFYLSLDNNMTSQRRMLEAVFDRIAISKDIHPTPNPNYAPVISTTIDLSGYKQFIAYRELQQQMRIDVIFATNNMDERTIGSLLP